MADQKESSGATKYILAVDVGTTTIRCHIYNQDAEIVGKSEKKVKSLFLFYASDECKALRNLKD